MTRKIRYSLLVIATTIMVVNTRADSSSQFSWPKAIMHSSVAVTYTATLAVLNQYWYADFEKSSFHFFNDWGEWEHIDKVGHATNAYYATSTTTDLYKLVGYNDKEAAIWGFGAGFLFMTTIEVLDGFSAKWGASIPDLVFNSIGGGAFLAQDLIWGEQRILMKLSSHLYTHPDGLLQERADNLFGTSIPERVLKDYNGLTNWISINPSSFYKSTVSFPKWLNIAVGYGASGIYGGFENKWTGENGNIITSPIQRYNRFFISPDIDYTRIPAKRKWVKTVLKTLNLIKFPAPTLEFNTRDGFRGHWLFF